MKQQMMLLGFIGLMVVAWVSMIGPQQPALNIPFQEVPDLPTVAFLGEGVATYTINPDHTFLVKYRRNDYKEVPGPTYAAKSGERVWDYSFVPDDEAILYSEEHSFGTVEADCLIQYVQIDDDVDDRINHFYVNDVEAHTVLQGMVTQGSFIVPAAGELIFDARDSVGLAISVCQDPATSTPTPTPTGTGTPTVTATATATGTGTVSPTPTDTATPDGTLTTTPATDTEWKEFAAGSATGGGISNTNARITERPSIAIASDGTAWIAWAEGDGDSYSEIHIRKWDGSAWIGVGGSASLGGISSGYSPSLAIAPDGMPWVAWADFDDASFDSDIYLRRWNGSAWVGVGGSASGGGISNNSGDSYQPSLAIDAGGFPMVAWEDYSNDPYYKEIYARRWNGSAWVEMGNSASGGGISNGDIYSGYPSLAIAPDGTPWVAWESFFNEHSIYVRRWNGSAWIEMDGSASGGGVSGVENGYLPSLAVAPNGSAWVAWSGDNGETGQDIYLRRWNGSDWVEVGGSASGGGISNTGDWSDWPSLAIAPDGTPWIAWQDSRDDDAEVYSRVYAKSWNGSAWVGMGGSAANRGISRSETAYAPSLAIAPDGAPWVSWEDYNSFGSGAWEIHARRWNNAAWVEIGWSASEGGISNNSGSSFRPSVAVAPNGNPYVAWVDYGSADWEYSEIYVRRWNGSTWIGLGDTASNKGFPNQFSFRPSLAIAPDGTPWVAWTEEYGEGSTDIYIRRWNGTAWEGIGGSDFGGGISNSGLASWPSLAIAPNGVPWIAWGDESNGKREIYILRWNGSAWVEAGGSASGGGVSNNSGISSSPSLAIAPDSTPWVAWEDNSSGNSETYVKRWNGSAWVGVSGSASGGGISNNSSLTTFASISIAPDGTPWVAWDDRYTGSGQTTYSEVFVRRWTGSAWVEMAGSASGGGISDSGGLAFRPSLAIHPDGLPWVAWDELDNNGNREIYARRWDDSAWVEVNGSASDGGISNTSGRSYQSSLALAPNGTAFVAWADDNTGDDEIYIRYRLPQTCYTLGLSHTGQGGDPLASPPNSKDCDAGQYVAGESITLTAAPEAGWQVAGWTGTVNDASILTSNSAIMPDSDHAVSVVYTPVIPTCYLLTRSHTGLGSDPVALPGSSTGCEPGRYVAGESISMTAAPEAGWQVAGWSGTVNDASLSTSNTVMMPGNDHTVSVSYAIHQVFLPKIVYDFRCLGGPIEVEPNNNSSHAQNNGPLCDGTDTILGLPNDELDYFLVKIESTKRLQISVTNHNGEGVQLGLDYSPGCTQGACFTRVATDTEDADGLQIDYPQANAGLYIIVLYTEVPKPSETRYYTLQVNIE